MPNNPMMEMLRAMYVLKQLELHAIAKAVLDDFNDQDLDSMSDEMIRMHLAFQHTYDIAESALDSIILICDNAVVLDDEG